MIDELCGQSVQRSGVCVSTGGIDSSLGIFRAKSCVPFELQASGIDNEEWKTCLSLHMPSMDD